MGLSILILGLLVFLGTHVFVSFRDARADVIARVGAGCLSWGIHAGFACRTRPDHLGLRAIIARMNRIRVWSPPAFMRHITVGLMLFAVIFVVAAFIPSHIKMRLKHPALASVKTWALAHLLSNGDLGSILLFGTFFGVGRVCPHRRETPQRRWTDCCASELDK